MVKNKTKKSKLLIHRFFWITISIKGIAGMLEITGGLILYFTDVNTLIRILLFLTQHELSAHTNGLHSKLFPQAGK